MRPRGTQRRGGRPIGRPIGRSGTGGPILLAAIGTFAGLIGVPGAAHGQDAPPPRFPFGTQVIVLPVQSAVPSPSGEWPGRARSQEEALRTMDAELAFALGERRGAEDWVFPPAVERRLARNPMFRNVHPERLAYEGLLKPPDARELLYDPLHSELRSIAALFDTRYLILPLRLRETPPPAEWMGSGERIAELLVAMIDIRGSRVVWHGWIHGPPADPASGALLAGLAQRFAALVAE